MGVFYRCDVCREENRKAFPKWDPELGTIPINRDYFVCDSCKEVLTNFAKKYKKIRDSNDERFWELIPNQSKYLEEKIFSPIFIDEE